MRFKQTTDDVIVGAWRLAALVLLAGCSQVEPVAVSEPITDPAQLFLRLEVDHPAVNLSTAVPYNTMQLTAVPRDAAGAVMPDAPTATFRSTDTTVVTVTTGGMLTALRPANEVRVIAELAFGGVQHTDTAVVNIQDIASPPTLASLSIHVSPDSAVRYISSQSFVVFIAGITGLIINAPVSPSILDALGNPIDGLTVEYASLDPTIAMVDRRSGQLTPVRAGHAQVVARTTAYGVSKADTATFIIQPPFGGDFIADDPPALSSRRFTLFGNPAITSPVITIVAGGIVNWGNQDDEAVDVIFDDPTNVAEPPAVMCDLMAAFFGPGSCGVGNIAPYIGFDPPGDGSSFPPLRIRQFPVAGIYPFHSTFTGATGQVIVLERIPPLP